MSGLKRVAAPLVVCLGLALAAMAIPAGAKSVLQPGRPAPDFSATDTNGKTVSLAALKGKTVVLEWTNDQCPYVGKHYGTHTMQNLQRDAAKQDVVWLTVISSAPGEQGHVTAAKANALTADRGAAPAAVLLDADGSIGRLYGASTTPHMFIIDKSGVLAYMGGIDDKPSAQRDTIATATPYVREALAELAQGKPVTRASTRPYGCSVKYGPTG